mmetsp:Transcript_19875/g.41824  ORF Transcript_19875/g.41824 Transcript_19875/m.41824 type:complete len:288 (-) Transcript_19875:59-922(-)
MKVFILLTIAAVAAAMLTLFFSSAKSDGNSPLRRRRSLSILEPETTVIKPPIEYLRNGKTIYYETAMAQDSVTDKVTRHSYQTMYGRFLLPYYYNNPTMKMLEIGLGCNMSYGPGASVKLYKALFPQAELWEAEIVTRCVDRYRNSEMLEGVNILIGDQGNYDHLDRWIEESGGNFDVVIDDGGNQDCQIWNSFEKLWPEVKPGGLYFIEDLEVSRKTKKEHSIGDCPENMVVPDHKIKPMLDVLLHEEFGAERAEMNIEFLFCQADACVIGKKLEDDPPSVWWNNV